MRSCVFFVALFTLFPAVAEEGAVKPVAKRVPFHNRLEAAQGEYRLLRGKGRMCSEGELRVLDAETLTFGLGSNIVIRDVDAGEKTHPQDDGCEIKSKTVSSGSKLTMTTRYVCPSKAEKKTVATVRFSKGQIEYEDAHSLCVYALEPKGAE